MSNRKQLYFISGITENKEFAKAVNDFFNGKKKFNEELVKTFFVDEEFKYAEAFIKYKNERDHYLDKAIEAFEKANKNMEKLREQDDRIIELENELSKYTQKI